nr:hypothetical protein [Tanacetum cinerariifolium]
MSDKSSPLKRLIIRINVRVKLSERGNIFTLLRIFMEVTLLLVTAWRESHASRYDRVIPKRKYLWYAGNPNNNNGRIEADVRFLGELGAVANVPMVGLIVDEIAEPVDEAEEQVIALVVGMDEDIAMMFGDDDFEDDYFSNDDSEGVEEEEVWEVNEEWLMAFVTPPPVPAVQPPSVYEVGGPSSTADEGPSFPFPAPGLPIPPSVIEVLSTRLGNLEYEHGQLVKKVIQLVFNVYFS